MTAMREVPDDIAKRLRSKDPLASIRWNMEVHKWELLWDGKVICALFHEDGTDMMELCWDEICAFLDRFDTYKDGPERIANMRKASINARKKAMLRAESLQEESMREAEKVSRTLLRGCPLQVYIKDNKIGRMVKC